MNRPETGMPSPKPEVRIVENAKSLAWEAAEEFVRQAREAVERPGVFTVALAGGSTPRALYALLAGEGGAPFPAQLTWERIHVFWGDERHVPPDHPDNNYRMARETMLSGVAIPPENVHRIRSENPDAGQAADEYAEELRRFFHLPMDHFPQFDLVLLGMGADGHTASLFPGTGAVHEQKRLVAAPWVEKFRAYRITLTPPVLNNAAHILFLVSGEDKANALQAVLEGEYRPERLPAQIIRPTAGRLLWMVDRPAARLLQPPE